MNSKHFRLAVSLLLAPCAVSAALVTIPDGDTDALIAAIAAGTGEPTTILLAHGGRYLWPTEPVNINGDVVIEGNASTISGAESNSSEMLTVSENGKLALRNLQIEAFSDGEVLRTDPFGMIENHGSMVLEGVGFRHIQEADFSTLHGAVIANLGVLTANRLSIHDVSLYVPRGVVGGAIYNSGDASLSNLTITDVYLSKKTDFDANGLAVKNAGAGPTTSAGSMSIRHATIVRGSTAGVAPAGLENAVNNEGHLQLANSFISGFAVDCISHGDTHLIGVNFSSDGTCGPAAELALNPLRQFSTVVGIPLGAGSAAIDAAADQYCTGTDIAGTSRPQDGDDDGVATCDVGAFEVSTTSSDFRRGGMNGLFFNPATDGHYVTIERTTPGQALVIWNTFDKRGQQAWVYGVGPVADTTITVDAYINVGGKLPDNGPPVGQEAQKWGKLTVTINGCMKGIFAYESSFPNFDSGQFDLDRLAFVHDLGCSGKP